MKDLFSNNSHQYQKARPQYSQALVDIILAAGSQREIALDVGAGSGQFTQLLAPHFTQVIATDLSANQLAQAPLLANVRYQVSPAHESGLANGSVDLITVAQAIHWFNFDLFYAEVERILAPTGCLAVVGYGLIQIQNAELQKALQHLYFHTLKNYWDPERRYIDENYQTIPFPFQEITVPKITLDYQWTAQQLLDYLSTWSAVQHYQQQQHSSPLIAIEALLKQHTALLDVQFPVLCRLGKRQG